MLQTLFYVKRTTPRLLGQIRCFNAYTVEYMPYANEQSASGTTHETVRHDVAHDKTVNPSDELSEEKNESQHNGGNDTLEWSAANSNMSHQTSGEESMGRVEEPDSPSFYNNKSKPEPTRKGLFEPLKKPDYKNVEEQEEQPQQMKQ